MLPHATTSATCQPARRAATGLQSVPMRPRRIAQPPQAVLGSFDTAAETVKVVSQVLTTTAAAVGAWYLLNNESALLEQDRFEQRGEEPCPRCNGRGYEPCACTRWNDGDVGCATCSKTGYMPCRACRGGGTAVPIYQTVRKNRGLGPSQ